MVPYIPYKYIVTNYIVPNIYYMGYSSDFVYNDSFHD